jgi:hypothetical protein
MNTKPAVTVERLGATTAAVSFKLSDPGEIKTIHDEHTSHPILFTGIQGEVTRDGTATITIPVPPETTVTTMSDGQRTLNMFSAYVAASIHLTMRAIDRGFYLTFSNTNAIVFFIKEGRVHAKSAGLLDILPPRRAKTIKQQMKRIHEQHEQQLERRLEIDMQKNITVERALAEALNELIALYEVNELNASSFGAMQNTLSRLARTQSSKANPVLPKAPPIRMNGGNRENGVTVVSSMGRAAAKNQPAGRRNGPIVDSVAGPARTENVYNNNDDKNDRNQGRADNRKDRKDNRKDNRKDRKDNRKDNRNTRDPEDNIGRQGILWRIGNMLREHGNNDNTNVRRENIPAWMRHVYGNRRARKILGYDTNNNKKGKFGFKFRTISFKPTHSFIPRHH